MFVELVFLLPCVVVFLATMCLCSCLCVVGVLRAVLLMLMLMLVLRWWWKPGLREFTPHMDLFLKIIPYFFYTWYPVLARVMYRARYVDVFLRIKMLNGEPKLSTVKTRIKERVDWEHSGWNLVRGVPCTWERVQPEGWGLFLYKGKKACQLD